jgi:hypothetical protein
MTAVQPTAYIVMQIRSGDLVVMHRMFTNKTYAYEYLYQLPDTSTSWWKVLEVFDENLVGGETYDIAVKVRWGTSNRVTYLGAYQPGCVPQQILNDNNYQYFVQNLRLTPPIRY